MFSGGAATTSTTTGSTWSWTVANVWGIPIVVEASALITLVLVAWGYDLRWQDLLPSWGPVQLWVTSAFTALLLFGSVLVHELAHSAIAKRQGIPVCSIQLFFLGGIAAIQREAKTIQGTLQLALAGPCASLAIATLFWGLSLILPTWGALPCHNLATLNAVLGVFNLTPLLPLDGGHVLSAAIWKLTGDRLQGVHWSARIGQIVGGAATGGGLAWVLAENETAGGWLALVGWFIFRNASRYQALNRLQQVLRTIQVKDLDSSPIIIVDPELTVAEFFARYLSDLPSTPDTRYLLPCSHPVDRVSEIAIESLQNLERSEWGTTALAEVKQSVTAIAGEQSLATAILKVEQQTVPYLFVTRPLSPSALDRDTTVGGWIDRGTILSTVTAALNLPLPDAELDQTRMSGKYPARLKLKEVAEALEWMESSILTST